MAPGNLERDLKRFRKARALSIWGRRGASKANEDAIKDLRAAIIADVLKLIKQHKGKAEKHDYVPPGVVLKELAEAIEKLKD